MMRRWVAIIISLLWASGAWAYDFQATVAGGQTLYFAVVEGGVEVVYPMSDYAPANGWGSLAKPTGALAIPAEVSHEGITYAVRSVGNFAFFSCPGLTSLTLAEGVASVGTSAFRGCSGLEELRLPASLASVGVQAFANCTALADVWAASDVPPAVGTSAFYGVPLEGCTLHVGCMAEGAYASAEPWSGFGSLQTEGCSVQVGVEPNLAWRGTASGSGTYDAGAVVVLSALPHDGFLFDRWSDGDSLNPRLLNATRDTHLVAMFYPLRRDTVTVVVPQTDTVVEVRTQHDTLWVHDSIAPTFYRLQVQSSHTALGLGVGSAVLPAGTEVEVCGLPLEGARFVAWSDDATDNPRRLTVTGALTLTALFEPLSVTGVEEDWWKATVQGTLLTVLCPAGEQLRLYDMQGRCLLVRTALADTTRLRLPAAGAYLVQVGGGAARRVVAH